jgi:hypothetical protein
MKMTPSVLPKMRPGAQNMSKRGILCRVQHKPVYPFITDG